MWISELQVINVKSFADSGLLQLSKGINVIVGKNNAGKSTLLQSVLCMQSTNQQHPFSQPKEARRIGTSESTVRIRLQDIEAAYFNTEGISDGEQGDLIISFTSDTLPRAFTFIPEGINSAAIPDVKLITHQEPNNFILPYTIKRFAQGFNPLMSNNQTQPKWVLESLTQLTEKIQPYTQSTHPLHEQFDKLCQGLIGSPMGIIEGANGHLPGIYTSQNGSIPLSQMGDGVPHIVGLIVHLLKAEKRLFVIEELENGINPEPLKLLLEEIKRSAKERQNQFLISTHSNIVLQSLASEEDCKIIEVTQAQIRPGDIPESSCVQIEKGDVEARRRVLMNLGYSLADSDMFDGWLILEEASAETVIRKFLIPQFAPRLINVLGIIATRGYIQVENQFVTLAQNFLYLHLTPAYKKRIWVIIDAGERESQVIERLRHDFKSWLPEHFDQFSEHDFEKYYPSCFQDEAEKILKLPVNSEEAKKKKQEAKNELRIKVMKWIDEDISRAKQGFESSAQEVIGKLKNIESSLLKKSYPGVKAEYSQNPTLRVEA